MPHTLRTAWNSSAKFCLGVIEMNKKLWIAASAAAILIPIAVVVCIFAFSGSDKTDAEPKTSSVTTLPNGSEIRETKEKNVSEFKSKYGYSVQYRNEYEIDTNGENYDFYIHDSENRGQAAISVSENNGIFDGITDKEQWDAKMTDFGKSADFVKTKINGIDAYVAHYYISDDEGKGTCDVILAVLESEKYYYTYVYTAAANITEQESNHLGAVLYTFRTE